MPFYLIRRRIRRIARRRRKPRKAPDRPDYIARKEVARQLAVSRLEYFRAEYIKLDPAFAVSMRYNRVAIRNQRGRWGSCTSKKNLNFNYRIIDLAPELRDYIIVHELCHLKELHHGKSFWDLMTLVMPQARALNSVARKTRIG